MKNGIEMVTDVYKVIDIPEVRSLIDGVILRFKRPKDSNLFDIIVNSIDITNKMLQSGIVNINIHSTNLKAVKFNGVTDNEQPSLDRMNSIAKVIEELVDGIYIDEWHIDIDRGAKPYRDSDGSWYTNIRLNYYSALDKNKNI